MRIVRSDGHWLWIGGPVPPGYAAITIGPVVSVRTRAAGDAELLRHEAVHVAQWRAHGVFGFLRRYLRDYLRWRLRGYPHRGAYRRIGFEIEATLRARSSRVGDAAKDTAAAPADEAPVGDAVADPGVPPVTTP